MSAGSRFTCLTPMLKAIRSGRARFHRGSTAASSEHRLRQELILGIGGVRALRAIGIKPTYWHATKDTRRSILLERLRGRGRGRRTFDEARERGRPETGIHDPHSGCSRARRVYRPMTDRYFGHFWPQLGMYAGGVLRAWRTRNQRQWLQSHRSFDAVGDFRNGVSLKHGEITREMWHDIWPGTPVDDAPITSITNGVHLQTWMTSPTNGRCAAGFPAGATRRPTRPPGM